MLKIIAPYDISVLKTEKSLKRALSQIEQIQNEMLPKMGAKDMHYLRKLIEVKSYGLYYRIILRASLMRTETRAGHYREDFPDRDNENWLKWIIISQKNCNLVMKTKPVPLETYKFNLHGITWIISDFQITFVILSGKNRERRSYDY